MGRANLLAIAITLLLVTGSIALAEGGKTSAATSADCNRIYKAKADAGKDVSTHQLARDLNLPVATVQHCLRLKRRTGPRTTPRAQ